MTKPQAGEKFIKMPLHELLTPKAGRRIVLNHFWEMTPDGEVLFFKTYSSPQCNTSRSICERLGAGGTRPVLIPIAYPPSIPHD